MPSIIPAHLSPTSFAEFPADHPIHATPALWHPEATRSGFAVVLFRKTFRLGKPLRKGALWVTASERFVAALDGQLLARGPARSDPARWNVPRVTLPELAAGRHTLSVLVSHFGPHAGKGQMGGDAFFLLLGEGELHEALSTHSAWQCHHDASRSPIDKHAWGPYGIYDQVGAGERIDAARALGNPAAEEFVAAKQVASCSRDIWGNQPLGHLLHPDPLPPMRETPEPPLRLAQAPHGYHSLACAFLAGQEDLQVPAHTEVRLVLDRTHLTNAYIELTVSGGKGARIRMVTAEAPYVKGAPRLAKTNRDEIEGKLILGHADEFLPDGRDAFTFAPVWYRPFRYIELTVTTGDDPLFLERLATHATAYPLREAAAFEATGPDDMAATVAKIRELNFRTIELCSHETFYDCPHYEQCQFPGDTRVMALYHYLVCNDDRLARKAIDDFHASRTETGLTLSHFPVRVHQIIPTFSLLWIGIMHDFLMYRGDARFLARYIPAARDVLSWFTRRLRGDGLLGFIEHAPFTDWTPTFKAGNAPQEKDGGSSILTLLTALAAQWQADLERAGGFAELADRYDALARELVKAVMARCWDARRGLIADTPRKKTFCIHAQAYAVLAGAFPSRKAAEVLRRARMAKGVAPAGTLYFNFYLAQAFRRAGVAGEFFSLLPAWTRLLSNTGLTTWPETNENSRSDCHGWGVTPGIEFLQTVLGVTPAAPGFTQAAFSPTLGPLTSAQGHVPTPQGPLAVELVREAAGQRVTARVETPVPLVLPGARKLKAGRHVLTLG